MQSQELRKFARDVRAALAAAVSGFVLAGAGVWAAVSGHEAAIGGAICAGVCGAVVGSTIGVIGASVFSLNRASFAGAVILGLPAAVLIPIFPLKVHEMIWLWAALSSFGSVVAQTGAIAAGNLADRSTAPQRRQFSLRQMLAIFIPVAIFLGYLSHFAQR